MLRSLFCLLALVAFVVAPAVAQDDAIGVVTMTSSGPCGETTSPASGGKNRPFGYFEGREFGNGNAISGVVAVTGWALDNDGIAAVDIVVDGGVVGETQYGLGRPRVNDMYPGLPDSAAAGFDFRLDTTRFRNGTHRVTARVTSLSGEVVDLNTKVIAFSNNASALRPFGVIEFPNNAAELAGTCDLNNPIGRYQVVSGWALDAGESHDDHGMGYVELLLDGVIQANTRRDCEHSDVTGAWTNCYGLRRLDVENAYPSLIDAPHAGYRFVLDLGVLLNNGVRPGHHVLSIRAGDRRSQTKEIDSISVNLRCDEFFGDEAAFGFINDFDGIAGDTIQIDGWALDAQGVARVEIYVDGVLLGNATYGLANEGATLAYPGFPNSSLPGWIATINTHGLAEGTRVLTAIVIDNQGNNHQIGERQFHVRN